MEREVGKEECLEIPSYQHTYDLTESLLRSEAFQKSSAYDPTCARHRQGGMRSGNESVSESLSKII